MTDACQRSIPLRSHGQPDEGLSHGTDGARGDSWAQAGRTRQGESTTTLSGWRGPGVPGPTTDVTPAHSGSEPAGLFIPLECHQPGWEAETLVMQPPRPPRAPVRICSALSDVLLQR